MERRTEMSRFLALIVGAAMALFIAGPAVAQEQFTVDKSYTYSNDSTVDKSTEVTVTKEVDILVEGELDATGGIEVQGDVVFKEVDVEVQDEEVVNKFFELDDSASSRWTIDAQEGHAVNALEQIQNGEDNFALVDQLAFDPDVAMNVGLQYQVGNVNSAFIRQRSVEEPTLTNNFAKQIQIGELNGAFINQNF